MNKYSPTIEEMNSMANGASKDTSALGRPAKNSAKLPYKLTDMLNISVALHLTMYYNLLN